MSMVVYRAETGARAAAVISLSARRVRGTGDRWRVILRFTLPDGAVRTHRGTLWAVLPPDRRLTVAGYQITGDGILVSFKPAAKDPRQRGHAVLDLFTIPFGLQAWGVTVVQSVQIRLYARCRPTPAGVTVWGAVRLWFKTPAALFPVRIPFVRALTGEEAAAGLCWRALAAVAQMRVSVTESGWIQGSVAVSLRCEGRPARPAERTLPAPRLVRELAAVVTRLTASPVAPGEALVQGAVLADLYWMDDTGLSRWTGLELPVSALVSVPGLDPGDRLEPVAVVERASHELRGGQVDVRLLVGVLITALRPTLVEAGGVRYRLDRVVGRSAATLNADGRLLGAPAPESDQLHAAERAIEYPNLPDTWRELTLRVGRVDGTQAGRWSAPITLRGVDGDGESLDREEIIGGGLTGPGPAAVAVSLSGVDGEIIRLATVTAAGEALPGARPQSASEITELEIPVPGPVRTMWSLEVHQGSVKALVLTKGRGLRLVEERLPVGSTPVVGLTAWPVLQGDRWVLRVQAGRQAP